MLLKSMTKVLAVAGCALAFAGCSADDVAFNGKIFDAVGMNTSSVKKTPKLAERSGIVVPPNLDKLPEPGSGGSQQAIAEVRDYDEARTTPQVELQRQQEEYCKKYYHEAKARGDQDYVLASGPLGSCHNSALSLINGISGSEEGQ
jgi:hypothetical protein